MGLVNLPHESAQDSLPHHELARVHRSLQNQANLTVLMSPDTPWLDNVRTETNGRPTVYTDAAIQAVLTMKVLFKLGLRQARGLVSSLLTLLKLDWPVPCFSTVSRRQAPMTVNIPARRRAEPLHLLVDSTGIKICGEGEWKVKKHGAQYRRAGARSTWPSMP